MLPPEFYFFNLTSVDPWTVEDVVNFSKFTCFRAIGSWASELTREILTEQGLSDLVDEVLPFSMEHSYKVTTIIDDEDLRETKYWSNETLTERYH